MTAETPSANRDMTMALADHQITRDEVGKLDALDRAFALIEFDLEGKILWANKNFLDLVGYEAQEILGRHHRIFCDRAYVTTPAYRKFWQHLGQGKVNQGGQFHRLAKYESDVWIEATYNPIYNLSGEVVRIVEYAFDVTQQVRLEQDIAQRSNEMSMLAQRLTQSIDAIHGATSAAAALSDHAQGNAREGREAFGNAIDAIVGDVDKTSGAIEAITKSAGTQDQVSSEVVELIGKLANTHHG